ncbi:DoxX-like family protein [Halopseudomonas yangmingensis]|uniref:DoxX-like family protein n=1 Tax=Halopseudomonas yangmingensis TaxID=1720063 RepID=A0A1I4QWZ0_9GAMM|nr:DoxX-like family protein [Halopseudomonas yangmingensis]SFM44325.1 DoxX-like family protein [Halopseudomonas yangmingensis]
MGNTAFTRLARWVVGLSWVYHGLFPKLLHVAPLEYQLTAQLGLGDPATLWLVRGAGVAELLFGLLFILLWRRPLLHWLNIAGLLGLLLFVAVMMPAALFDTFNPVTTNVPLLALSLYLLAQVRAHQRETRATGQ